MSLNPETSAIKKCSKCAKNFECKNKAGGCWCESFSMDKQMLNYLANTYSNCLCPDCLKQFHEKSNKIKLV
ncbi:MAG: cysteine-rich CWC family protein [Bacteroidetes bacterium]|nr:cysteine-rich CWC family protein [Bacteroidota bacterium]